MESRLTWIVVVVRTTLVVDAEGHVKVAAPRVRGVGLALVVAAARLVRATRKPETATDRELVVAARVGVATVADQIVQARAAVVLTAAGVSGAAMGGVAEAPAGVVRVRVARVRVARGKVPRGKVARDGPAMVRAVTVKVEALTVIGHAMIPAAIRHGRARAPVRVGVVRGVRALSNDVV